MPLTPLQTLRLHARSRPRDTAFIFHDDVWTYQHLAEQSECVAHGLAAHGVKPGDRVVLHMLNRPEIIVAYQACFRLGAIAVPLRCALAFSELHTILRRLQPALYIGEIKLYPNIARTDAALLPAARRVLIDDFAGTYGVRTWNELGQADAQELPAPSIDQPTLVLDTASHGQAPPRSATHTSRALAEIADFMCRHGGLDNEDIEVSSLPLVHGNGVLHLLHLLQAGVPFVVQESFDADIVLDHVERIKATCLFGFPAQYEALVRVQQIRPRDLSSLRYCATDGDACPPWLQQQIKAVLGQHIFATTGGSCAMTCDASSC